MRILVAPDKFRGSMTAAEAAVAMALGVRDALPDAAVVTIPLADGGEGTLEVLLGAVGGRRHRRRVTGPLGDPVDAEWAMLDDGTAVIELAGASGAALVELARRDPLRATTFGTGELIRAALDHRPVPQRLVVALGGSATNDGGAGLLAALGARIVDANGQALAHGGAALAELASVDLTAARAAFEGVRLVVACDVDATLAGPTGASRRFGPQKGAAPEQVEVLDAALARWGDHLERAVGAERGSIVGAPGAGAAGGAGTALRALGGELVRGAELVMNAAGFRDALRGADLVLTGEGRIDAESGAGKVIGSVTRVAGSVPTIAFAGSVDDVERARRRLGLAAVHRIGDGSDASEALARGPFELRSAVASALCAWSRTRRADDR